MSRIIEKIQKLLKLASNAGSEAEAALAAQRAADLMAEHEIHEAELALAAGDKPREVEPIEKCFEVTRTSKKVAWHMRITNAAAESYGAQAYWVGGRVVLFGRLSAVQAASYTAHYLMREVERLTDKEAPSGRFTKMYRNAFRLGAANRIAQRIRDLVREKGLAKSTAAEESVPDVFACEGEPEITPSVNTMALAIIEKDRKEVEDEYNKFSKSFGKAPRVGKVSSGSGYHAGRAAGEKVNIAGGGKGLPRGQDSLR